jgi:hypothetical protein
MSHNDQTGGSRGSGYYRPMNFNADEATVLWGNGILVPPAWHLPHGWHVSVAEYAIPPLPEGDALDDIIDQRWQLLPPEQRNLPENTPRRSIWMPRLQRERQEELGKFAGPYANRYNLSGRRRYWRNRDIDDVLREHSYVYVARRPIQPPERRSAHSALTPPRSATRSSSSDGHSVARSATGIIIRDKAAGSSSVPSRPVKEEPEEEWEQLPSELQEEMRTWWVERQELQATLSRHPNDPKDTPG